jgi:hypothetical protein
MTQLIELNVNRKNIRDSRVAKSPLPSLNQGEVLVAIDKFGLTANNVSYAISGDSLGYWGFYPGMGDWGNVPVWGCANVVASNNDDIDVGERFWGLFPMASHTVIKPGRIGTEQFADQSEHRQALPRLYNTYRRTQAEPAIVQQYENERCLLVPLFTTAYVIYDYLLFNDLFTAKQIIIGSVSSKTGFGLAKMLYDDPKVNAKIIGITSAANKAFVDNLSCCDEVILYGDEHQIDNRLASAYIDMSGNIGLTTTLHQHLGDNIVDSAMVGASHWEAGGIAPQLPGAKPTFFFAPTHIGKRDAEWGAGATMKKGMEYSIKLTIELKALINIEWIQGAENLQKTWLELLDNKIAANRGLMVALHNDQD